MIVGLALVLSMTALATVAGLLMLARRAAAARRELAVRLHDRALAFDHRCDVLQRQLDELSRLHRVEHVLALVNLSERQGRLGADAARRLERYALELRGEALLG